MRLRRIVHRGEVYVTVTDAASCYGLEITEVRQWIVEELIEAPARIEGTEAWPAARLDRIAALVRCTRLLGLDPRTVRALVELGDLELR